MGEPGPPPPPRISYTSREPISSILTFLESLGQMIMSGQPFFSISKIKDPFLGKIKNKKKSCGLGALFMRDYCASYTEKV